MPKHFMIMGFGQMGECVAVEAKRRWPACEITVYDRRASLLERPFKDRHAGTPIAEGVSFVDSDLECGAVLDSICLAASPPDCATAVIISVDDDSQALKLALSLTGKPSPSDTPIFIRLAQDGGLADLVERTGTNATVPLVPFGMTSTVCSLEILHAAAHDGAEVPAPSGAAKPEWEQGALR
jgi:hypothetical protein